MSSNPLPQPRRIVTGHADNTIPANGEPAVTIQDTLLPKIPELDGQAGRCSIWTTECVPTKDNLLSEDAGVKVIQGGGLVIPTGANVRFNDLAPGAVVPMHRTATTDILVWLSGQGVLITPSEAYDPQVHPEGPPVVSETPIRPGDVVLQRGTLHAWKNPSTTEWARSVVVMLGAEEMKRADPDGTPLEDCFILPSTARQY